MSDDQTLLDYLRMLGRGGALEVRCRRPEGGMTQRFFDDTRLADAIAGIRARDHYNDVYVGVLRRSCATGGRSAIRAVASSGPTATPRSPSRACAGSRRRRRSSCGRVRNTDVTRTGGSRVRSASMQANP